MEKSVKNKRQFTGTVVSDKMSKTAVVRVDRTVLHSTYHKRYTRSTKLKAHDQNGEYHVGEVVVIEECKPISRDKRWRVVRRLIANR